ncbi:glycosyl hydrolase [Streptomyces olivaceoviridis]|uniref:glycosyl hydrolase n=1 Tax=Streptomyces olivaceoviridis TaxID=1921 RepID=UPI0033280DB0
MRVEPWGPGAVLVRARLGGAVPQGLPGALLDARPTTARPNWPTAPATSARVAGEGTLELALDDGPVLAALAPRTRT